MTLFCFSKYFFLNVTFIYSCGKFFIVKSLLASGKLKNKLVTLLRRKKKRNLLPYENDKNFPLSPIFLAPLREKKYQLMKIRRIN